MCWRMRSRSRDGRTGERWVVMVMMMTIEMEGPKSTTHTHTFQNQNNNNAIHKQEICLCMHDTSTNKRFDVYIPPGCTRFVAGYVDQA